jgi:hypothetical protein
LSASNTPFSSAEKRSSYPLYSAFSALLAEPFYFSSCFLCLLSLVSTRATSLVRLLCLCRADRTWFLILIEASRRGSLIGLLGYTIFSSNFNLVALRYRLKGSIAASIYRDLIGVARKAPVIALRPSFSYLYRSLAMPYGFAKLSIVGLYVIEALYPSKALTI